MSWTALLVVLAVALLLLPVLGLIVRGRWLAKQGWVFDCSLRSAGETSTGWMLGVARLVGDRFEWYRVFSLSLRPRFTVRRVDAYVASTREPTRAEVASLYDQGRIAAVDSIRGGSTDRVEVALAPRDMTAFLSWFEASPPGLGYER
ncbi:DUF2550 domain-containing protein [Nigerium massiliense]|uniref:DUF2550 domain-containing protein n=1 Tax=Nigerium massiliense TaxID=1522317 RepID=UPI00058E4932|nr:DUF2550 domain-containing protein [Nigerium massiliense]